MARGDLALMPLYRFMLHSRWLAALADILTCILGIWNLGYTRRTTEYIYLGDAEQCSCGLILKRDPPETQGVVYFCSNAQSINRARMRRRRSKATEVGIRCKSKLHTE